MGKRYDWQVTPQNTSRFLERRTLFLVAIGMLTLNLMLAGIFLAEDITNYFVMAFLLGGFAVAQCFDRRREMWTWGYITICIVFAFVVSAILILCHRAYWWFVGYGIELGAFALLTARLLKSKKKPPRR